MYIQARIYAPSYLQEKGFVTSTIEKITSGSCSIAIVLIKFFSLFVTTIQTELVLKSDVEIHIAQIRPFSLSIGLL